MYSQIIFKQSLLGMEKLVCLITLSSIDYKPLSGKWALTHLPEKPFLD